MAWETPFCTEIFPISLTSGRTVLFVHHGGTRIARGEATRRTRSCETKQGMMWIGKMLQMTQPAKNTGAGQEGMKRTGIVYLLTTHRARRDLPFPDTLRDTTRYSENPRTWNPRPAQRPGPALPVGIPGA